jgi:lipoprotein-anchoring transpeptidase ErfK/SrfK
MLLLCLWIAGVAGQQPVTPPASAPPQPPQAIASPLTPESQQALQTQVMLDRAGFSPGEIDGAMGLNTERSLAAYQKAIGQPDALQVDPLIRYRITDEDVAGPFTPEIPNDLMAQASLPSLGYRDAVEAFGEHFHASPALLRRLNPQAKFAAGEEILVPNVLDTVQPVGPPRGPQTGGSSPADVIVTVRRSTSSLTITDGSGHTLFYAPVTTGSEHDPLPIGEWKVTGVRRHPEFHYSPELFWDAEPSHSKATIKAGPNNPVGLVWIDITRPHYGLHGTPEPAKVGKTESHGCVRLTNWDAMKVASLVRPGSRVVFAE